MLLRPVPELMLNTPTKLKSMVTNRPRSICNDGCSDSNLVARTAPHYTVASHLAAILSDNMAQFLLRIWS